MRSELLRLVSSGAAITTFVLAGLGIIEVFPGLRRIRLPGRLAYAYILGMTVPGLLVYAASNAFGMRLSRSTILPFLVVPIVAGLLVRWRRGVGRRPRRVFRVPDRLTLLALAIGLIISFAIWARAASQPGTDWDGRMTWSVHARYVRGERTVTPEVLTDARWYVTHPRYPLLFPLIQVMAQETFNAPFYDDRFERPFYAALYPTFLLLVWSVSSQLAGRTAAAWTVLLAESVPFFAFVKEGGACGTYSDLPLACVWGAGILLLLGRIPPHASTGVAAGLLLGAGILTKNEGLPLAAVGLAAAFLSAGRWAIRKRREPGAFSLSAFVPPALATVVVAGCAAVLLSWQSGIPNRNDEDYSKSLREAKPVALLKQVPSVIPPLLKQFGDTEKWGAFWLVAAGVFVAGARGLRRGPVLPIAVALAGALATYFLAYLLNSWLRDELIGVTFARLLTQMSVPGFALLAVSLREVLAPAPRQG